MAAPVVLVEKDKAGLYFKSQTGGRQWYTRLALEAIFTTNPKETSNGITRLTLVLKLSGLVIRFATLEILYKIVT